MVLFILAIHQNFVTRIGNYYTLYNLHHRGIIHLLSCNTHLEVYFPVLIPYASIREEKSFLCSRSLMCYLPLQYQFLTVSPSFGPLESSLKTTHLIWQVRLGYRHGAWHNRQSGFPQTLRVNGFHLCKVRPCLLYNFLQLWVWGSSDNSDWLLASFLVPVKALIARKSTFRFLVKSNPIELSNQRKNRTKKISGSWNISPKKTTLLCRYNTIL